MSGGQYLNAITENATRLGQRIQESFSEHTRDLAITRGSSAYLDTVDDGGKSIRTQLDSNSDREKLDALKRLVAMISKGRNVSEYFAQVVKNVASPNLEIRKLVYIYLLRYAEQEPDLALLSINTFQRDLADSNPLIRAMALRVLSGIKVPMIGSIVVLAIKKCASDLSPYVRKTASLAIPKCYQLDPSHQPALIAIITTLLADRSPVSIGSAVIAFEGVCPTRLDLLHQHYRRLCRTLIELDEWGQVSLTNILLRYARTMLPRPVIHNGSEETDSDVKLLLTSVQSLFQSRNPAVILSATRVIYYAGTPSYLRNVIQPLLRLLAISREVERVTLTYIAIIAKHSPILFAPYHSRFLVRTDDSLQVKLAKIRLLLTLLTHDTHQLILREMIDYADDTSEQVASSAIHGIGTCATSVPESTPQCLTALINMIKDSHDTVVSNAVVVLKDLVQKQLISSVQALVGTDAHRPMAIIARLAQRIDDINHAQARACVLWLVGQYAASDSSAVSDGVAPWAPDVLRKAAKGFAQETPLVKLQVITLAAKLSILDPMDKVLGLLSGYVLSLARYDLNYDVRDRARMVTALLAGVAPTVLVNGSDTDERGGVVLRREQVRMVLFDGKSALVPEGVEVLHEEPMLATLSAITEKPMNADTMLPDWLEHGVESSLRDSPEETPAIPAPLSLSSTQSQLQSRAQVAPIILSPQSSSPSATVNATSSKASWADLESFYADSKSDEDEEEDDNDETGESESESEESGDDEETDGNEENSESMQAGTSGDFHAENKSTPQTTTE